MKMAKKAGVGKPISMHFGKMTKASNWWHIKFADKSHAVKFARKYKGKLTKFTPQADRWSKSNNLRINNLSPKVSEFELKEHIHQKTKKNPKNLEIRYHCNGHPSYALVQMKTSKEADLVVQKVRMTAIQGQSIWARKSKDVLSHRQQRNEHRKGKDKLVNLMHLPQGIKQDKLLELCRQHGNVESVTMGRALQGYSQRIAHVMMVTPKGAAKLFDAFNGKKLKGSRVTTKFPMRNVGTNCLHIGWFPKSVTASKVKKFVMSAAGEVPGDVRMMASTQKSSMNKQAAYVTLSGFEAVNKCVIKLDGTKLDGVKVQVSTAKPSAFNPRTQKTIPPPSGKKKMLKQMKGKKMKGTPFAGKGKMKGSKVAGKLKGKMAKGKGKRGVKR